MLFSVLSHAFTSDIESGRRKNVKLHYFNLTAFEMSFSRSFHLLDRRINNSICWSQCIPLNFGKRLTDYKASGVISQKTVLFISFIWIYVNFYRPITEHPGSVISTPVSSLIHAADPFLRSHQLCSYSRTSQEFMESEGSLPCSQEPSTGPYPQPDRSSPYHPII
jgi:hypothetical protein